MELEQRAQAELVEYLSRQSWDFMFTSTYKVPATHAGTAINRTFHALLKEASPARGFIAAEQHQSGLWHTHGLWSNKASRIPFHLHPDTIRAGSKGQLAELGFTVVSRVAHQELASRYCAKYLTKFEGVEYEFFGKAWNS